MNKPELKVTRFSTEHDIITTSGSGISANLTFSSAEHFDNGKVSFVMSWNTKVITGWDRSDDDLDHTTATQNSTWPNVLLPIGSYANADSYDIDDAIDGWYDVYKDEDGNKYLLPCTEHQQ